MSAIAHLSRGSYTVRPRTVSRTLQCAPANTGKCQFSTNYRGYGSTNCCGMPRRNERWTDLSRHNVNVEDGQVFVLTKPSSAGNMPGLRCHAASASCRQGETMQVDRNNRPWGLL